MTTTRAAYFRALLENRTGMLTPAYRRLWESQVEYYEGQPASATSGDAFGPHASAGTQAANVGNSEPLPAPKWRAANEGAWAALFDALGVAWKYEALEPELSKALRYVPDFWLCDRLAWVEVKSGTPTPGEFRAARELLAATGERVYMVSGWPRRKRYGLWVFAPGGEAMAVRNDICDLALCNLLDVSFRELWRAMEAIK